MFLKINSAWQGLNSLFFNQDGCSISDTTPISVVVFQWKFSHNSGSFIQKKCSLSHHLLRYHRYLVKMSYSGDTTFGLVLLLLLNAYTEMGPKIIIKTEAGANFISFLVNPNHLMDTVATPSTHWGGWNSWRNSSHGHISSWNSLIIERCGSNFTSVWHGIWLSLSFHFSSLLCLKRVHSPIKRKETYIINLWINILCQDYFRL